MKNKKCIVTKEMLKKANASLLNSKPKLKSNVSIIDKLILVVINAYERANPANEYEKNKLKLEQFLRRL